MNRATTNAGVANRVYKNSTKVFSDPFVDINFCDFFNEYDILIKTRFNALRDNITTLQNKNNSKENKQ